MNKKKIKKITEKIWLPLPATISHEEMLNCIIP